MNGTNASDLVTTIEIPSKESTWNILVVDDEEDVFLTTKFALQDKKIIGRRLHLFFARSVAEGKLLLQREDIACIILDVVMETDDAGFRLVRFIREELKNFRIRIIIRTGQPGFAPEGEVIEKYEINDYKEKTELTYQKLVTIVTSALRSYRDISTIEDSRIGMRKIIDASNGIYKLQSLRLFAIDLLKLLVSLIDIRDGHLQEPVSGFVVASDERGDYLLAGHGKYQPLEGRMLHEAIDDATRQFIDQCRREGRFISEGNRFALSIEDRNGKNNILCIDYAFPERPLERDLVDMLSVNAESALSNITTYEKLEATLAQRDELMREVHHRVKNNLQLVSSLISIVSLDRSIEPDKALRETRDRIYCMAAVHDHAYESGNVDTVDFEEVAKIINENVIESESRFAFIELVTDFADFRIPLTSAIPCALLYRELVARAFDYASAESMQGKLNIVFRATENEKSFELSVVADAATTEPHKNPPVLYYELVRSLVNQLSGRYDEKLNGCLSLRFSMPRP